MTTEQSASLDAALDDVFSSGRDRGSKSAPPEVEAAPEPAPVVQEASPPVQEPPKADLEEPSETNNGRTVPLNEHLKERKKYKSQFEEADRDRQTLKTQLEALHKQNQELISGLSRIPQAVQPQPQPQRPQLPDPFTDPEGYVQAVVRMRDAENDARIEARRNNDKLNFSEHLAREKYGDAVVDAAFQASRALAPADLERVRQARHPYDELVKWHQSQETLRTVGGDLEAFRKRVREEEQAKILEDLKAGRLTVNGPAAAQPQHFPGTLAAATQQGPTGQVTKTLEAATGDVFSPDRRVRGMRR